MLHVLDYILIVNQQLDEIQSFSKQASTSQHNSSIQTRRKLAVFYAKLNASQYLNANN